MRQGLDRKWMGEHRLGNACSRADSFDFLSVYVDNTKMAGKKHNLEPTWERLVKR